jgi:hypothetical protein
MPYKAVICGGGNGAHVLAVTAANFMKDAEVTVLTLPEEVAKIEAGIAESGGIHAFGVYGKGEELNLKGKPSRLESDAAKCIPDADLIVLTLPAFVHAKLFETFAPHMRPGVTVVGLPGQSGFELVIKDKLGEEKYKQTTIMNLSTLPWNCRISEYGKGVKVVSTKDGLQGSVQLSSSTPKDKDPATKLQEMLGKYPVLDLQYPLITWSLYNFNGILHPTILYGKWKNWDGVPLEENPLFYTAINEETGANLQKYADEILEVAKLLGVEVPPYLHFYMGLYGSAVEDSSNMHKAITTNKGYAGLTHPTKKTDDGKFVPDWTSRYLTEDVPNGFAVVRGIADIVGAKTPTMDMIFHWAQEKIGKEYLTADGKMAGKDIGETRAPQRYGIHTKEQLMALYS